MNTKYLIKYITANNDEIKKLINCEIQWQEYENMAIIWEWQEYEL